MEGQPSELEALNGAVVRLGREARVPTPVNGFYNATLAPLETQARRAAIAAGLFLSCGGMSNKLKDLRTFSNRNIVDFFLSGVKTIVHQQTTVLIYVETDSPLRDSVRAAT